MRTYVAVRYDADAKNWPCLARRISHQFAVSLRFTSNLHIIARRIQCAKGIRLYV